MVAPLGGAGAAALACGSLPPGVTRTAQKLPYELIKRPRYPDSFDILLSDITDDTGIENASLLEAARELEKLDKAYPTDSRGSAWAARAMPSP